MISRSSTDFPIQKDLLTAIYENQESEEILKNCVLVAKNRDNRTINYSELPNTIWDNLSKQMDQQDPLANIQFSLTCPSCQHHWQSTFDIMSYLWTEIDSWAKRMLQEVCILARAYHWSEKEILGMSTKRRQMYLELIS
jgi:hypothetical protein